jgi:hypothetical protein
MMGKVACQQCERLETQATAATAPSVLHGKARHCTGTTAAVATVLILYSVVVWLLLLLPGAADA